MAKVEGGGYSAIASEGYQYRSGSVTGKGGAAQWQEQWSVTCVFNSCCGWNKWGRLYSSSTVSTEGNRFEDCETEKLRD